jgi:phenylalanyl-tRNA synthetase alpha chain
LAEFKGDNVHFRHIDYDSLHPLERKVLPHLRSGQHVEDLVAETDLTDVEVMRAVQWLASKGVLEIHERKFHVITVGPNGLQALKQGLPEYRFLKLLSETKTVPEIQQYFTTEEFNAALGILKKNNAIVFAGGKITKTHEAAKMLDEESHIMHFLQTITTTHYDKLDKKLLEAFRSRKDFITVVEKTERSITLAEGFKPHEYKYTELIEQVTPEVITTKEWINTKFRKYDVDAIVPQKHYGKQHFVTEAIEEMRRIWLSMGFTEMEGPMIQTAFWDLDALYVPQDHPAREMQDTLYVRGQGKLPKDMLPVVKAAHENGVAGSKGWGYVYSETEAKKLLLRTHTTVLSAQTIAKLTEKDLPAKFFSVGKVFRNETVDWKHLAEFHQVEGIVIGNVTLQDLIGMQQQFYAKLGFPKVRFRPGYFPYTEPSCEVDVWHPERQEWVEIGGMGVFRPEVVEPLTGMKNVQVLAWGLGLERIITMKYGIKDLRHLYNNDLKDLRNKEAWM